MQSVLKTKEIGKIRLTSSTTQTCTLKTIMVLFKVACLSLFHVVLPFESRSEILWCNHSNENFLAVLLHGTICFFFNILQNEIWYFS